jgi:hypothetical protein
MTTHGELSFMRRIALLFGTISIIFACSSEDAATTTDSGASNANAKCCVPDPIPGCCMDYGGWSSSGTCAVACDGMPIPSDPGWTKIKDDHGCDVWSNPNTAARKCGAPFEAGPDTSPLVDSSTPKDTSVPDTSVVSDSSVKDSAVVDAKTD